MLRAGYIVGVSKTAYGLATPRCLDWRHDLPRTSRTNHPSDFRAPGRQPAGRRRGRSRSAIGHQAAGVLLIDGRSPHRRPGAFRRDHHAALGEADGAVPDGVTVFDDDVPAVANLDPALLGVLRQAAAGCRGRRGRVPRHQWLAFPGVPGAAAPRGGLGVRLRGGGCSVGGDPGDVSSRVGATRSTSGSSMPRRGCPNTAPSTGCARSTATSPGTTSCAPKPSTTAARACTPTRRTIHGCSSDVHRPLFVSGRSSSAWPRGSDRPGPARWLTRRRALPGPRR